jgi:hypothetical protein
MPEYTKSERTARKARKQARLDAAAELQVEQAQGQAAMQARLEQLLAANALLKKQAVNRKNSHRKKAKRVAERLSSGEAGDSPDEGLVGQQEVEESFDDRRVVHASASCEEDDDDVLAKWDAEEAVRIQEAVALSLENEPAMQPAVNAASPARSPVPTMDPLSPPHPPELPPEEVAPVLAGAVPATASGGLFAGTERRGTARMQCGSTAKRMPAHGAKLKRGPLSSESERSCEESEEEEEDESNAESVSTALLAR